MRKLIISLLTILLVSICSLANTLQIRAENKNLQSYTPLGELYDIGGAKMHLYCQGERTDGSPAVILEAGTGDNHLTWFGLQQQISRYARVCSYDRRGYGWSDPAQGIRTVDAIAGELSALLDAADLAPPYVLVGHSYGGLVMRYFAARNPESVRGVVFIDATPASTLLKRQSGLRQPLLLVPPALTTLGSLAQRVGLFHWLTRKDVLSPFEPLLALPLDIRQQAEALYYRARPLATSANEQFFLARSARMAEKLAFPQDVPVIAYIASLEGVSEMLPFIAGEFEALSRLSQVTVLPNNHYLHLERPDLITTAIMKLVEVND